MASYISLRIDPVSIYREGRIGVNVNIVNKGDEPAMSVWTEAAIGDSSSRSDMKESLEVNEAFRALLDLGNAPCPPGVYTVAMKIHYTDGSGHPFTAIRSIPLVTEEPDLLEEPVTGRLSFEKMRKRGEVVMRLSYDPESAVARQTEQGELLDHSFRESDKAMDAKVTLVLPEELECFVTVLNVSISPREEKIISFKVRNLSALPGSTYSVFAVVDYLFAGQHRSLPVLGCIKIEPAGDLFSNYKIAWLTVIIVLLVLFILLQFPHLRMRSAERGARTGIEVPSSESRVPHSIFPCMVLAILLSFTLYHIPPSYLLLDTLTTGGDTPAHNYLASHLKEQLFKHGRIVSWAGGWWCGFPMFQFYFYLPYLLIALLSFVIPFNIAFKIVSVLGILLLPASACLSARIMRLPRPVPTLLAIAMIPLLFDKSHTMWGVNIYSTLAGMISNSISFPIMLFFIASASRDSDDGQFRLRTVFLLAALVASHFFTSIVAGLSVAILPFLRPKAGTRRALFVLAKECGLAFLLMAWWLIPLVAKQKYTVDFGTNWDVKVRETLPVFVLWLMPFALIAMVIAAIRRIKFIPLICWMLIITVLLFFFGARLSPVFVNVRMWPFIIYSLLALVSAGVGLLVSNLKANELAVTVALIAAFVYGIGVPNDVRHWAKWNYEGVENKQCWPVFKELVLPLRGTPGRLANDLRDENNSLGSSRIFECVPHVTGKPILEGGIVNSALTSMFSYYIQSETSENCAGFPAIVTPTSFNFTNATRHMELFNVKHFIAKWSKTKEALAQSRDWRLISKSQGWELYELLTHDGIYVFIPKNHPVAVKTDNWKKAGLEWIYTIQAVNQPFVFLRNGEVADKHITTVLSEEEFAKYLSALSSPNAERGARNAEQETPSSEFRVPSSLVLNEKVTDNRIRFRTDGVGLPHIIKCSYYPNWKVRGAEKVYMVTPCFMLVYPDQEEVELYYGYTLSDNIGRGFSALGLIVLVVGFRKKLKTQFFLLQEKCLGSKVYFV